MKRALGIALLLAALGAGSSQAARPLRTAVVEPYTLGGADSTVGLGRVRAAGATLVRSEIYWPDIAPTAPQPGTDPADHRNPAYDWSSFDVKLRRLKTADLEPILAVAHSPAWARQRGPGRGALPEPSALAAFAQAAARRYDGRTPGLPRVRYWQLWIEPNVSLYFVPQVEGSRPVSPLVYRELLEAFTPAIRRGNPAARVVAGGTSPFGERTQHLTIVAPLRFLRDVLCLTRGSNPRRTCRRRVPFDVWAHHPYTSGGPQHEAFRRDDVSLGDLPEMRRVLLAAQRLGQIDSSGPVGFWVTEFSWDSSPPDPRGVPSALHARWVAEALYRMWSNGVALVTWLQLRDEPFGPNSPYQGGLWFRGSTLAVDRPKPALRAFRFPLVAFPERGRLLVWGRTPAGRPGTVSVERTFRGGWARLGVLRTNAHGIFTARFPGSATTGYVRARLVGSGERARPFSLRDPGDRFFNPFGS